MELLAGILALVSLVLGFAVYQRGKESGEDEAHEVYLKEVEELGEEVARERLNAKRNRSAVDRVRSAIERARARRSERPD